MSQSQSQSQSINDLEVAESPQHPCQCSAMTGMDSIRIPREQGERSAGSRISRTSRTSTCTSISTNANTTTSTDTSTSTGTSTNRIASEQELPRSLEQTQAALEPMKRLEECSLAHEESEQISLEIASNGDILDEQAALPTSSRSLENQSAIFPRHGHTVSCISRNLDLSRNLAFEAARRVQESTASAGGLEDNHHPANLSSSSPLPILEPSPTILENCAGRQDFDKQPPDEQQHRPTLSQKQNNLSKEKPKNNMQQILNPYQNHHEPAPAERTVHGHFHSDHPHPPHLLHAHLHKHTENFRSSPAPANFETADGLMGFPQHQRPYTHHHHGTSKGTTTATATATASAVHLSHGSQTLTMTGHHLGSSLTAGLNGHHVHRQTPSPVSMNHGPQTTGTNAPAPSHHHPGAIATGGGTASIAYRNSSSSSPGTHHRMGPATGLPGHHPPSNPTTFTPDHHGTSSALSGASSNSSMMNHGGSPLVHRHLVVMNAGSASSHTTTPLAAGHHRAGSTSASLLAHSTVNHHHVSSSISCESSSSNANTRAHSRLDHVHDHHHHLQPVHTLHPPYPEASRPRERAPSTLEHHTHHRGHIHNHAVGQANDTKNTPSIGVDTSIQVVSNPSKSKCQCHVVQHSAGTKRGVEGENGGDVQVASRTHQPPALPPRPPPRPARRFETTPADQCHSGEGGCCKKYVVLCCLCGGLSAAVGCLFLAVHAVLSAHTASLALFETVPSYIPGIMLIKMGLFTMLLARRKHRCGLLMKVCGSVGVVCALVCVLVTVTTTVIHMSRLQGLRECVYTARARSCTCYGAPQSKDDRGVLFEGTPHCEAVHGALYACLRALFGVSVAGILACIFSCMLVYQLSTHEKKKMYWEQLELRCRSLYGQGGAVGSPAGSCGCCNDCGGASPWWAQTPGNLYTPNPDLAPSRRWRLPWSRSRGPAPSPDSNYGFHTQAGQVDASAESAAGPYSLLNAQSSGPYSVLNAQTGPYTASTASYSVLEGPAQLWGPPPPYSDPNSPARRPQLAEQRPRSARRIENFESAEDHRTRSSKRPSDNYENAEEISNSTDPEGVSEGTIKGKRARKPLKGVENGAFQQEANTAPKQSESELYFGDVSSCCGPGSSFYDLAVEKEGGEHSEGVDYLAARLGKRQLSKRSRMPLPLPLPSDGADMTSGNYANSEEPRNARGPFLAPDAQYEVIQQTRYSYYASKEEHEREEGDGDGEGEGEVELQLQMQMQEGTVAPSGYYREEDADRTRERDYRDYRSSQDEEPAQCCLSDSTTLDSGWQSGEQQQSDDNVRPVNV